MGLPQTQKVKSKHFPLHQLLHLQLLPGSLCKRAQLYELVPQPISLYLSALGLPAPCAQADRRCFLWDLGLASPLWIWCFGLYLFPESVLAQNGAVDLLMPGRQVPSPFILFPALIPGPGRGIYSNQFGSLTGNPC